jgi:Bacterial membrane protein YfhO
VLYSKFHVPLCLFLLSTGAWFFATQAGLKPWVAILTGLAAGLNSNFVSYACWGLPPKAATLAMILFACGLIVGKAEGWRFWVRAVLAGFATGLAVVEGADVGAILSLYVASFAAWHSLTSLGINKTVAIRRSLWLLIVPLFAAWISAHSLVSLVGTQISGISGMAQTKESYEERWTFATGLSFPIDETLRIAIPGLYGYRMDTPDGGAYWGRVGFDGKVEGRFNGGGEYAGVLVLLLAAFALAQALRAEKSPYQPGERKRVLFWAGMALVSLLLAYGRNAPFYQFVFALPYFSTIRIPMKFLHGMHLCLWILFAYGLEALARTYLSRATASVGSIRELFDRWTKSADEFDRRWVGGLVGLVIVAAIGALVYTAFGGYLSAKIAAIPFNGVQPATAWFSIREVWFSLFFLTVSAAVLALVTLGRFSGERATQLAWVLGTVLVLDLVRANLPWVKYYDYQVRYDKNPIMEILADRPWEHRVTANVAPQRSGPLIATAEFTFLQKEWLENHLPYFHIQALDIDQMPRMPELEKAYLQAFLPPAQFFGVSAGMAGSIPELDRVPPEQAAQIQEYVGIAQTNLALVTRMWQLTNTRYVFAWHKNLDWFNRLFDPKLNRFTPKLRYALTLKPGVTPPSTNTAMADAIQAYTAVQSDRGPLALLEFSGALPRAKLYSQWESISDTATMLYRLRSPEFDPATSVIVDRPIPGFTPSPSTPPGDVSITTYSPKHLTLSANSKAPSVLLLNDRWHENWKVTVDGKEEPLLRANFIMQGVALAPGQHTVEFRFATPVTTLWVSASALAIGLLLTGLLVLFPGSPKAPSIPE